MAQRLDGCKQIAVVYSQRNIIAKLNFYKNEIVKCIRCRSPVVSKTHERLFSDGRIEPSFRCVICNCAFYAGQGTYRKKHKQKFEGY